MKGSDFDAKLDAFIEKQLMQGVDMETILANAVKDMQQGKTTPVVGGGDDAEFDPSKLNIDEELFKSFQQMINERNDDPQMQKMLRELMNDPGVLKDINAGGEDDAIEVETMDQEEMDDLESLKSVKAGDDGARGKEALDKAASDIFKKKK